MKTVRGETPARAAMSSTVIASGPCSTARYSAAREIARRVSAFLRSRSPVAAIGGVSVAQNLQNLQLCRWCRIEGPPAGCGTHVHYCVVPWDQLELPFGVRDGVSSAGDFSASSLFHQTVHNKRLIGGALSRISRRRVIEIRRRPVLDALIELSEGHALPSGTDQALARIGPEFMRRARIG